MCLVLDDVATSGVRNPDMALSAVRQSFDTGGLKTSRPRTTRGDRR
jgi:hypothetical protein